MSKTHYSEGRPPHFVHDEEQVLAQLSDSEQDNLIPVGQDDSKFSTEVGYKIEERINY